MRSIFIKIILLRKNTNMYYTQSLKDIREDHDLKQETVAITLNITRQQYQLYESGKRKLLLDKLILLCKFYDVSADYLLGFANNFKPLPKQ